MKHINFLLLLLCFTLISVSFGSCAEEKALSVLFQAIDGYRVLTTVSKEESPDSIMLSKSKKITYRLDVPVGVPGGYSLEISYSFSLSGAESVEQIETALADWEDTSDVSLSVSVGDKEDVWILPVSLKTLGLNDPQISSSIVSYTVPLSPGMIDSFSINVENNDSFFSRKKISLDFSSFKLVPTWFGIAEEENILQVTPFVYVDDASVLTINPPEKFRVSHPELLFSGLNDSYSNLEANPSFPVEVDASYLRSAILQSSKNRAFPLEPVTLSPGEAVSYDRDLWRRENYEVFRWDQFPGILIFDTADYDVQDRLFKRLAFFVEKAGFEGRLSRDEEIAHLHGWNAHDYRAEDLARFFETARITNFSLNDEELELKQGLLEQKIIVQHEDGIFPGIGAIVSISRESAEYLRYLFIVHESYHGLYFIDQEFEAFCRLRWEHLNPAARLFISEYFASQRYDTENEYLMANELMAYCLQQPVSRAGDYFGKTLAGRIYANSVRRHVLPERDDASGSWPLLAELFTEEAEAFSEYVHMRWGLRAGSLRKQQ